MNTNLLLLHDTHPNPWFASSRLVTVLTVLVTKRSVMSCHI